MASTVLSLSLQRAKRASRFSTLSSAGVILFSVIVVALHLLRPDLNPISRPTSAYAVGPYSFLMTSAFFSMGLASLALVVGLFQGVPHAALSRTGLAFLGMWSLGVLIAMLFPMDPEGVPQTISGTIHQAAGPFTFLSLTIGITLVSRRFKHDEVWYPFHRTALVLSMIMLVTFTATFLSFIIGTELFGLFQRIALATAVVWMLLTAARLRSVAFVSP